MEIYMLGLVFLLKILADWQFSRKALEKVDRLTLVVEDKFHKVDNRLKALEEGNLMEYLTVGLTVVIFGGLVYIWYIKKEKDDLKRDLDNAEGVVKLSEKRINAVEASVLKNEKEKRENESEKAKNTTATEHLARFARQVPCAAWKPKPCNVSEFPSLPVANQGDIMLCSGASDNPGICFSLEFEIKLENYIDQAIRWHEQVQACPYVVEVEK